MHDAGEGLHESIDRLQKERRILHDALLEFGRHAFDCESFKSPELKCSCGLDHHLNPEKPISGVG